MQVKQIRSDLDQYLVRRGIKKKFDKQVCLFQQNPRHPSLNTERLEPKPLRLYSFRIDRKYRAIFIFITSDEVEIVDVNDHYQ